jgi:hypothetical protein
MITLDGVMQAPGGPEEATLEDCSHSPSGVIFANFKRDGEVKTGSF